MLFWEEIISIDDRTSIYIKYTSELQRSVLDFRNRPERKINKENEIVIKYDSLNLDIFNLFESIYSIYSLVLTINRENIYKIDRKIKRRAI